MLLQDMAPAAAPPALMAGTALDTQGKAYSCVSFVHRCRFKQQLELVAIVNQQMSITGPCPDGWYSPATHSKAFLCIMCAAETCVNEGRRTSSNYLAHAHQSSAAVAAAAPATHCVA
jgi:hypothetical protein